MRLKHLLSITLVLFTAVSLVSCSGPSAEAPEPARDLSTEADVVEDEPSEEAAPSMLVTALADVKSAVVQIEAQGTFVEDTRLWRYDHKIELLFAEEPQTIVHSSHHPDSVFLQNSLLLQVLRKPQPP